MPSADFPCSLFGRAMFKRLSIAGGCSLLGGFGLAMIPVLYVSGTIPFTRYSPADLRTRFSSDMERSFAQWRSRYHPHHLLELKSTEYHDASPDVWIYEAFRVSNPALAAGVAMKQSAGGQRALL